MSSLEFNNSEVTEMRSFYENELENTLRKLHHIQSILHKINSSSTPASLLKTPAKRGRKPKNAVLDGTLLTAGNTEKRQTSTVKKVRKGKPGRSSVWGKYVLDVLKTSDKPLTYVELFAAAQKDHNIKPGKEKSLHQSIINSTNRLRTKNKSIDTFALQGSRTKYVALKTWFEKDGSVKAEYLDKVKK
jgi:hypothetical protein